MVFVGWDAYRGQLGADPITAALHTFGTTALIFLLLTLTITPARKLTGWNWLSHFRRMLGLYAFFYACLHFSIYFFFQQSGSVRHVFVDTVHRRFIFFGMAALAAMIPLAITSTNGMIKRMGAKAWKRLHRLVYVAAAAGVLHYYLLVKSDTRLPLRYAAVLGVLLGYRVIAPMVKKKRPIPARA